MILPCTSIILPWLGCFTTHHGHTSAVVGVLPTHHGHTVGLKPTTHYTMLSKAWAHKAGGKPARSEINTERVIKMGASPNQINGIATQPEASRHTTTQMSTNTHTNTERELGSFSTPTYQNKHQRLVHLRGWSGLTSRNGV